MGFELQRIDINHDLAVTAAKGLRYARSRDVGHLVPNIVLAEIAELRLVQALPFQSDQTNGKTGGVKLQNHRRKRPGWKTPEIGHGEIRDSADRGVGVQAWLKIDFDETYAGKGARFDVVDAARKREKPFEAAGDVGFNLLRRHS